MQSTPETDKTTAFFLSPSAPSICIIFHSNFANNLNKWKLWKENEKTKTFSESELYFGYTITRHRDSQCVCQVFYRKVKTQLKAKHEKEASFHEGKKLAEEQFIRSRLKTSTLWTAPSPKEQLFYEKSNQQRTKLPNIVKIALSSHIKLFLLIWKLNISYLVLKFTSLSTLVRQSSN